MVGVALWLLKTPAGSRSNYVTPVGCSAGSYKTAQFRTATHTSTTLEIFLSADAVLVWALYITNKTGLVHSMAVATIDCYCLFHRIAFTPTDDAMTHLKGVTGHPSHTWLGIIIGQKNGTPLSLRIHVRTWSTPSIHKQVFRVKNPTRNTCSLRSLLCHS